MKTLKLLLAAALLPLLCTAQKVNDDLEIRPLTENVYLHTSWCDIQGWGRVGSNGLVVVSDGRALMIDTPMDTLQTKNIVDYVRGSLGAEVVSFIPGHWHGDCVGGMEYLQNNGVQCYAYTDTNAILESKGMVAARNGFADVLRLGVGNLQVEARYLGGGHATDNIVVWIPSDRVLFGGCMVKDLDAEGIGNLSDAAPFAEWLETIEKIEEQYPDIVLVVPGHGLTGGKELLWHTKNMLQGLIEN